MKGLRPRICLLTVFCLIFGTAWAQSIPAEPQPFDAGFLTKSESAPSPARAFFYSLLVPGLGQVYAGAGTMTRVFVASEAALWSLYFTFRTVGNWKEADYKRFAVLHAGVDPEGKDRRYYVNLEHYDSMEAYNQAKLRQRNLNAVYPAHEGYEWEWDSRESRLRYESLRVSSDKAFNRALLVTGAVVLNHLASAIDAARAARKGRIEENPLHMGVMPLAEGGWMGYVVKVF
ncbi:MAG TPA: hypothetical protein ENN03_01600 [bacterium]|nr:hypothetical protein [bacterium]